MSESEYSVFGNKKRKTLSLECKIDIINEFDGGMKICEIGRKMDLAESTVRTVIKDRERIRAAVESDQCLNSSVIRHEIFNKMERMLKSWYRSQIRMNNHCIDQSTVCRQAKWIFERLKEEAGETAKDETFLASNGWFNRFKNRCDWLNIAENSDEVLSVDSDSGSSSFLDKYKLVCQ
ncbi:unnamed protein product [Anisakis simplex]|uniref:HTH CENPB-type domain-containing protein n=1 Tax=Anisakis simplex TaxID=6269 RepID=A0A0M3KAH7_ANISI|nr:unnamed protein product [Anisakis simplex]